MRYLDFLKGIRDASGPRRVTGLPDEVLLRFLPRHPELAAAIEEAASTHRRLGEERPDLVALPEDELVRALQADLLNFYAADAVNPYVPLAARGPWIVTAHGAVVHDSGGYGMLGFGHAPEEVLAPLRERQVMANVMTASFSQRRLLDRLVAEIGHRRPAGSPRPYARFVFLNSGSEAMTLAGRIADVQAKVLTDPGGPHAGARLKFLSLRGSFHGRTDPPARVSDSTQDAYRALATFRDHDVLLRATPNDPDDLRATFARAEEEGIHVMATFLEPVQGEGAPGRAITPEFYRLARDLTRRHGSLLVVDSIQAGLRCQGVLSICDFPGFEDCEPPDAEAFSKAINAGQFPLSVLALGEDAARLYRPGIYGNTMTANPRAMDVACAVMDLVTPELRENIRARGREMVARLQELRDEFPDVIAGVSGTGLLCAADLDPARYKAAGRGSLEERLRHRGIGVIHGGKNALRFTPHFRITSEEIDLAVSALRDLLREDAAAAA
ncbi:aminotransferase class III-fold pyridoxal phosphate-dependent enzyme [Myxococcota bacterium]|nr:aminotransferase class III-fold pyridoxal phosphate-dependent enzyme [Myxococcota bacterium]